MYDPKIARFLQEDTYSGNPSDPLSLNLYTYCANNPLIYYDPTGHNWISSAWNATKNWVSDRWDDVKAGFAEVVDTFEDPIGQMYENNREIKSFITDNLGIKEGTLGYNAIKNAFGDPKTIEAIGVNGINLIKGAWQMGETMGKPIANTLILGINYVDMKTGKITEDDFYGWYDSWHAGAEADNKEFAYLLPNMGKGFVNSAFGLYNNGLNFFNSNATLEQKTQAVGDFYNVAFGVEAAKGIIDTGVPVIKNAAKNVRNNYINSTSPEFAMTGGGGIPFTEGLYAMNNMGKVPFRNVVNATVKNAVGAGAGGRLSEALKKAQEDSAKRQQMETYEEHHWINQATLNGKNPHPLVQEAYKLGVDIVKEKWNIESIPHRGGHTDVYYDFVRTKLDNVYEIYNQSGGNWNAVQMREALIDVKNQIKNQYESGNLNLYTNK